MKLEHSFTVPVGIDEAWRILLDVERIGPCMPGAAVESVDGDDFTGSVKVKLGPIGLTYKGKASFAEKDEAAHRAVIDARGKDARGNGTAAAKVTATLSERGSETHVQVDTDLDITGKPAQFGRGVMTDVGNKLIGQFATNLAAEIESGGSANGSAGAAAATTAPAKKAGAKSAGTASQSASSGATSATTATKKTAKKAAAKKSPSPSSETSSASSSGASSSAASSASTDESTDESTETTVAAVSAADPGAAGSANGTEPSRPRPAAPPREVEPIDLLGSAGPAVAKRLVPPVAALLLVILFVILRRRRG